MGEAGTVELRLTWIELNRGQPFHVARSLRRSGGTFEIQQGKLAGLLEVELIKATGLEHENAKNVDAYVVIRVVTCIEGDAFSPLRGAQLDTCREGGVLLDSVLGTSGGQEPR